MGLTKEYLRYAPSGNFNIIASSKCNMAFVLLEGQIGRYVAVGACEHIIIWDLRLGEKAQTFSGEKSNVSYLCANPNNRHLAAGYGDGNVQVYDIKSGDVVSIFSGHKSEVTALAYDQFGHKLATGSKDTEVIVWDTVSEKGICRFSGHKGSITDLVFMAEYNILITSSKDTFVKFWDLDTQHCFKTLVGHRTEVWSLSLMKQDRYLVTGCGDAELRVWKLTRRDSTEKPSVDKLSIRLELTDLNNDDDPTYPLQCLKVGSLLRAGRGRVVSISCDTERQILTCCGTDSQLELFLFCTDHEANIRFKKRLKKEQKKAKKLEKLETNMDVDETKPEPDEKNEQVTSLSLRDEIRRLPVVKASGKIKSANLVVGGGNEIRVAISLSTNVVEMYSVKMDNKNDSPLLLRAIKVQGHRSEVRAVAFSSDNLAIVSGSAESVKLWNRSSQVCLRTIETGYVLSICFVPGDRHVLCGLKDGRLIIMDIASGDILEEIPAHRGEIWTISLLPDMRGCVSGGGDHTCKWWQFELIRDETSESKAKVLSLLHTRTLALEETVLCVRFTPNDRFVAVALLDSTVKIFFAENFKLYLSLYGHKLPVLCMDISYDSRLIATGSADRNVKIWGLDFGDCHKSIFAHDDSVTGLQFVGKTHNFFTCGKDGSVKEWDADSFEKIMSLPSHHGEAWCLAVSPNGKHVVSCGSDKVLRTCELTDQILVLEDEREEEREREEAELATGDAKSIPGQPGLILPSKKTVGSEKAADSLLECLEIIASYSEELSEHATHQAASKQVIPLPAVPPIMQAYNVSTPVDFLLETLRRIRSSDLEEALLILPFTSACELLQALPALVARGDQTELVCRVLLFLLKVHHAPLVANKSLLALLKKLQKQATLKVTELRDTVGYNFHGLQYLQRDMEMSEGVQLFRDATLTKKSKDKRKKQREAIKRSITILSG